MRYTLSPNDRAVAAKAALARANAQIDRAFNHPPQSHARNAVAFRRLALAALVAVRAERLRYWPALHVGQLRGSARRSAALGLALAALYRRRAAECSARALAVREAA